MLYLEENKVDLILLDGTLPDGDGFDFCRQEQRRENSVYRDDALLIDFENLQARLNGRELLLTPTEFRILRLMTVNRTVTKQLLLEKIWDTSGNFVDEHTVAVNINRLRKKLEGSGHEYIKTVYGMGYQWRGMEI